MSARAERSLAGGVTSSWQITRPQAVWISHGAGSKVYDVDGTEYVDLHGGYGAGLAGHAHPAIVEAVRAQVARGTHFAQPTEDAIAVAEELAGRFGLELWRFENSGTEATMDAVHLMRAVTGRDLIIKVEGCYHGHHDSVQVSVAPEGDAIGPADRPIGVPGSSGIPQAIMDLTVIVGYNDLDSVARVLAEHPGEVAGMIIEPIMMNAGIIHPDDGYLAGLKELLHRHGALLTFDEVKTGLTAGPAGATGVTGVTPDVIALGEVDRRGPRLGRRRRHRRGDGARRERRLRDGRHLQRQPARHGGHEGDADRGRHPCGLRAPRRARRTHERGAQRGARAPLAAGTRRLGRRQGVRHLLDDAGARTTGTSSRWTTGTTTRTGSSSTTAASSCRRGERPSSG